MSTVERPLRADAERNRQRILDAARELFAERGLAVTLDDIAHRAGVGVGTAYRRFQDKEALIDALFEDRIDELATLAEDALANDSDAWSALATFLESGLALQAADRGLHEVLLGTLHGRERLAKARDRMKPPIDELVARAHASGDLRPDVQPTDLPLVHLMLGAVVDYTRDIEPDAWRRYLTIVLDGLRTRRDAPSPLPTTALDPDQVDDAMRAWRPAPR
jgi:AcrR family transcriptional regulator